MSPPGRKVIAVAIAGFGVCNDQRAYLKELCGKPEFRQLEVKQCGDLDDMERWLQSEGFAPEDEPRGGTVGCNTAASVMSAVSFGCHKPGSKALLPPMSLPTPPAPVQTQGGGAEHMGVWASLFGTKANAEAAKRERLLADAERTKEESQDLSEKNTSEELYEAAGRIMKAAGAARAAGVTEEELFDAEARLIELEEMAQAVEAAVERSNSCCWWCCSGGSKGKTKTDVLGSQADVLTSRREGDNIMDTCDASDEQEERIRFLEKEVQMQNARLEDERSKLRLPEGTKCLYLSSSWSGWVPARIVGFDGENGAYHLNIRKHVKVESISPGPDALANEAWPVGALVTYQSESLGKDLPAVIRAFNEGRGGVESTYDLDVKKAAPCSRIRPRLP